MGGDPLAAGSTFAADFRVLRPLSSGGMGAVYVVEQISTGAQRALKLMHRELAASPKLRERFEQEARVSAKIPSDHVVSVHAAGVDAATGFPYLVMELLEGQDLWTASSHRGPWAPDEVCEIFEQLCHGLSAAHRLGIVHRDIKPENVFLATPRRAGVRHFVKILDFGIAKIAAGSVDAHTAAVGTPMWMAPEQARESTGISPATDVWALGLLAFWLLSGRSYFRAANASSIDFGQLLMEILHETIVPASVRAAELGRPSVLPIGFDAWFSHAVARAPSDRFPDAQAAFDALLPVLRAATATAAATAFAPTFAATLDPRAPDVTQAGAPPTAAIAPPVQPPPAQAPGPHGAAASSSTHRRAVIGGGLALLVVVALAIGIGVGWKAPEKAPPVPSRAPREPEGLSSDQIQSVVARLRSELRKCWEGRHGSGRLELALTIAPSGTVVDVGVSGTPRDPELSACLSRRVEAWRFPRAEKQTTARVPVVFWSSDAQTLQNPYDDCTPPYTIENGVKRMKKGCL